jgi:hypothetical protein
MSGWVRLVAARPRLALTVLAVLAALALAGAGRLGIDTDSSRMLSPDLPFQERAHALNEAFPQLKNTIVIVLRGPRADPVDAAAAGLSDALAGAGPVRSVFAPAVEPFFLENGLLYLETDALEERLTQLSKSANLLAALREDRTLGGFLRALDEAQTLAENADIEPGALAALHAEAAAVIEANLAGRTRGFAWADAFGPAEEGRVTRVVTVEPELDYARLNPAKGAMEAVDAAIAALPGEVAAEVEIGVTGDPVLRAEELGSVTSRLGISLGLSLALVAAVLLLGLGTAARAGLAFAALVVTLVLTTGAAGAMIGALNLVSVAFVVLMVGLGIDFAIHLMAHLDEDAERLGPRAALLETAGGLGPALVLTAATTAAAFLAFATTDFVGMAQLGLIGGVGVLIAFAVSVTLIPAAVSLRPGLARGRPRWRLPEVGAAPRWVAWGAIALGLAAAVVATGTRFDADPMGLRDPEGRSVEVYRWLADDPERAPLRLGLLARSAEEARAAAARIEPLPEVRAAVWLGDLVPAEQDEKLALIDLAWPSLDFAANGEAVDLAARAEVTPASLAAELPETGAGARLAAALGDLEAAGSGAVEPLEGALFRYFPDLIERLRAQLAVDRVAVGDLPEALAGRYRTGEGLHRVEILAEEDITDPAARRDFLFAVKAVAPGAGGPPEQIVGAADAIARAMVEASAAALAVTALLAWLAVGRAATVAAILLPVLLAGAITLAAGVLLGIPLNYANIIVLPLMIGIGVDSGVHLALRTEREAAVFSSSTPRAVAYSALTTIGAFATLALSEHRGTASMGVMLAIALLAAVLMAFAVTPALVNGAGLGGRRRSD